MVQKKYVCGDDNDEMMKKKTGKDKRREGERERERQRYRNIKAQCEHLRDLSDGHSEILFCIIFTSFLSKFVMVRMKINNMKISIAISHNQGKFFLFLEIRESFLEVTDNSGLDIWLEFQQREMGCGKEEWARQRKKHEQRSESSHVQALDMISNGLFWWENSYSDGGAMVDKG